jgi:hypothetical protein
VTGVLDSCKGMDMSEGRHNGPASSLARSDDGPATGVLCGVPAQCAAAQRRGRRRVRVLVAAGAIVSVAVAGVTATLAAASRAPSALATVTSAVVKTSAVSYNFSLDTTVQFAGRDIHSDVVTGASDPGRELGAELLTARGLQVHPAGVEIRFIGRYVYTWVSPGSGLETIGKPWNKAPAPPPGSDALPPGEVYGFSTEQPVSPSELLGVLRSAATVRDEGPTSGPGWAGTRYAFTVRLGARESVSGTVYVDQQGRVRRLVTITRQGVRLRLTTDRDITFGDFGTSVRATPPPASQVEYTSGRPYWGFFF